MSYFTVDVLFLGLLVILLLVAQFKVKVSLF